jgi:helicase
MSPAPPRKAPPDPDVDLGAGLPGFRPASAHRPGPAASGPPARGGPPSLLPDPATPDPSARVPLDGFPLHPRVVEILRESGIRELYPPQAEALGPVLSGKSLLLACPTSSGKSLVAYMALVHAALEGRRGVYIVPLRALASEKFQDLEPFRALGLKMGLTMGERDLSSEELEGIDILVSTSEKVDSLLRHRNPWMDRVGVVVADEVHLLRDPGRGPTLEVSLTRLRRRHRGLQVVALSATVGNSVALARWLGAAHVASTFRPVPLRPGVFREGVLTFLDGSEKPQPPRGTAVDQLVHGALDEGGQALVFVNSRRSTVSVASALARGVGARLAEGSRAALPQVLADLDRAGEEETESVRQLRSLIPHGVAFHNASLTNPERAVVERAFREGKLRCLVATTTLAMGLNLPARRVVVRDTTRYDEALGSPVPLPAMEVQQMLGRAGRPRYDPYGEAVLIARDRSEEEDLRDRYLTAPPEDVESRLASVSVLRTHVLALVASGEVRSWEELEEFLRSTYYGQEESIEALGSHLRAARSFLETHGLLRRGEPLRATDFGHLTSDLYLDPVSAVLLRRALSRVSPSTPPIAYLASLAATPDIAPLYLRAGEEAEMTVRYADLAPELLLKPDEDELMPDFDSFLGTLKTATLLEAWLDDRRTLLEITQAFHIGAGDLRARVERAEWLLSAMAELARRERRGAARALDLLSLRVRYGIREELSELVLLRGIGRVRSRLLYDAGWRDLTSLGQASLPAVARVLGSSALAESVLDQARSRHHPSSAAGSSPARVDPG